jgi:hypothetical protein
MISPAATIVESRSLNRLRPRLEKHAAGATADPGSFLGLKLVIPTMNGFVNSRFDWEIPFSISRSGKKIWADSASLSDLSVKALAKIGRSSKPIPHPLVVLQISLTRCLFRFRGKCMTIAITDDQNVSTNIGAGALPRGAIIPIQNAFQIQGWVEVNQVQIGGARGSTVAAAPFGSGGGDCLFDTGSLFCFDGPQNSDQNNVLMVLWAFQLHPASGDQGNGLLNSPPSSGVLDGGSISWTIV